MITEFDWFSSSRWSTPSSDSGMIVAGGSDGSTSLKVELRRVSQHVSKHMYVRNLFEFDSLPKEAGYLRAVKYDAMSAKGHSFCVLQRA